MKLRQATAGRWQSPDSHPRLPEPNLGSLPHPKELRQLHTDQECLGQPELSAGHAPDHEGCRDTEEGEIRKGFLEEAAFDLGLYSDPASSPRPLSSPSPRKEAPDASTSGQGLLGKDFCLPSPRWALRAKVKGEGHRPVLTSW